MSAALPRPGLAVTPDQPSEPPHCSATTSSDAGTSSRVVLVGFGQNLLDCFDPGLDGLEESAVLLDRDDQRCIVTHRRCFDHVGRLVDFASKREDDVATDVRVVHDTGQRALEDIEIARADVRPAAALVRQRNDSVDIRDTRPARPVGGNIRQCARWPMTSSSPRPAPPHSCGCRPGRPARLYPMKVRRLRFRNELDRLVVLAKSVVELQLLDAKVLSVDVLAGFDLLGGESDDLPVLVNDTIVGNIDERDFMPHRDHLADPQTPTHRSKSIACREAEMTWRPRLRHRDGAGRQPT